MSKDVKSWHQLLLLLLVYFNSLIKVGFGLIVKKIHVVYKVFGKIPILNYDGMKEEREEQINRINGSRNAQSVVIELKITCNMR